jgi:hypothetical protein
MSKGTNQDLGEMNLELVADEENQDRAQRGKNEAGGMDIARFSSEKSCG